MKTYTVEVSALIRVEANSPGDAVAEIHEQFLEGMLNDTINFTCIEDE